MKKVLLCIITLIFLSTSVSIAHAANTAQTTASSSAKKSLLNEKLDEKINELKEKIASRVSELNLVEKRGIIGIVVEASANKITIKDITGKTRFVDVDEITKFTSSSSKGSFGLSDLTKGTKISVLGLYNKQSQRILARFIRTTVDPLVIHGTVSDIDKKNFYIVLTTENQKQTKIDILTTTKILGYDSEEGIAKSGFSKIQIGDRAAVIGYPDKKDPNLLEANRFVDLAGLPKNPKIVVDEQDASDSAGAAMTPIPTKKKTTTQ